MSLMNFLLRPINSSIEEDLNIFEDIFEDIDQGDGVYNPLFTITGVSPAEIFNESGSVSQIYITGEDFPERFRVEVAPNVLVLGAERLSSTTIVATIRYNGGSANEDRLPITVIAGRTRFTMQSALHIVPGLPQALFVESFVPGEIIANGNSYSCTITGIGFTDQTTVSISGSGVTFTRTGSTSTTITGTLVASIGAAQTFRDVTVTRNDVSASLGSAFYVLPPPVSLTITDISPDTIGQGTTGSYVITGTGFVSGATVSFSGTGLTVNSTTWNSSSQLTVNVTASGGAITGFRNVTVTNPSSAFATLSNSLEVTANNIINIDTDWLTARTAPYFLNVEGATYVLQTNVTVAGTAFYVTKRNVTFNLNGYTINYNSAGQSNRWGICLYNPLTNTEIGSQPGWQTCTNFHCHGGSIISLAAGDKSYGVMGRHSESTIWNNLTILSRGKDAYCGWFLWPTSATVTNCYLECVSTTTFDRHAGPAVWRFDGNGGGNLTARYNVLLGGNSGFVAGSGSTIEYNVIRHSGFATNGYGGWFYRNNNVKFNHNIVIPSNGRGVLANAGSGHVFDNNVILHLENPNSEFGRNLNPPAMRSRYEVNNVKFRGNTTLGIGNATTHTSASSLYLTNHNQTTPCEFSGNTLTTIFVGTPSSTGYAQPITLEAQGRTLGASPVITETQDVIDNNVCRSNLYMIRTAGYDGEANQTRAMIGNTFNWVTGDTARDDFVAALNAKLAAFESLFEPARFAQAQTQVDAAITQLSNLIAAVPLQSGRVFWWSMFNTGTLRIYATITDSTFGAGVNPKTISGIWREMPVSLRVGSQLNYQVLDGGIPVANANVTAVNNIGDTYYLRTDASGFVSVPIIAYGMDKAVGSGSPFVEVARTSTNLNILGNVSSPWVITH